jgi:tetratricopeptide (TPR) repeat protein
LVARATGDFATAREQHQAALALMESLEEKLGIVFCLLGLGWAEQGLGDLAASRAYFDEALQIAAAIYVPPQVLEALTGIASCLLAAGHPQRARELLSTVVAHPATADPVRRQAQGLLSNCPEAPAAPAAQETAPDLEPLLAQFLH